MRVSSVQSYGVNSIPQNRRNVKTQTPPRIDNPESSATTFKSKAGASAIGATLGGILGAAAITFISGGAAIPFIVGAYTVSGAAAGASIGSILGEDENKDNNKD